MHEKFIWQCFGDFYLSPLLPFAPVFVPAVFCNNCVNFSQTTGWMLAGEGGEMGSGRVGEPKTNTFWSGSTICLARLLAKLCEMIWLRSRQIIREICVVGGQLFQWTRPGQTCHPFTTPSSSALLFWCLCLAHMSGSLCLLCVSRFAGLVFFMEEREIKKDRERERDKERKWERERERERWS